MSVTNLTNDECLGLVKVLMDTEMRRETMLGWSSINLGPFSLYMVVIALETAATHGPVTQELGDAFRALATRLSRPLSRAITDVVKANGHDVTIEIRHQDPPEQPRRRGRRREGTVYQNGKPVDRGRWPWG